MFRKAPPPDPGRLADRVRQLGQAKPQAPTDTGRDTRRALFRSGTLALDNGERLAVAIKNLSSHGARIEFLVNQPLPSFVTLSEPLLKLHRRARIVWQREGAAGLRFVEPA